MPLQDYYKKTFEKEYPQHCKAFKISVTLSVIWQTLIICVQIKTQIPKKKKEKKISLHVIYLRISSSAERSEKKEQHQLLFQHAFIIFPSSLQPCLQELQAEKIHFLLYLLRTAQMVNFHQDPPTRSRQGGPASLNHLSSKQDACTILQTQQTIPFFFFSTEELVFVTLKYTFLTAQCRGKAAGFFFCKGNMP